MAWKWVVAFDLQSVLQVHLLVTMASGELVAISFTIFDLDKKNEKIRS